MQKITFRDEIWNTHHNLPAAITAAILPAMDCKRNVKELYEVLKQQHSFIKGMKLKEFLRAVARFYHGLSTHASSRQFFLSSYPFELKRSGMTRPFRNVRFSDTKTARRGI